MEVGTRGYLGQAKNTASTCIVNPQQNPCLQVAHYSAELNIHACSCCAYCMVSLCNASIVSPATPFLYIVPTAGFVGSISIDWELDGSSVLHCADAPCSSTIDSMLASALEQAAASDRGADTEESVVQQQQPRRQQQQQQSPLARLHKLSSSVKLSLGLIAALPTAQLADLALEFPDCPQRERTQVPWSLNWVLGPNVAFSAALSSR